MKTKIKAFLKNGYLVDIYRAFKHARLQTKLDRLFKADRYHFYASAAATEKRFDDEAIFELAFKNDKTVTTPIEPHYTYHPAWAARVLAQTKPEKHIDISSTLNFCTLVSAFVPIDFYDYRPADIHLNGLACKKGDLTNLPFESDTIKSLSCMHTIEHIGLGRYGDPIDYDGDLKAIAELKRVLSVGGDLLIVTPIGKPKIEFNAHRIYSYQQILNYFSPLKLVEFSLVPDAFENVVLIKDAPQELANEQIWGCGCFWFKK